MKFYLGIFILICLYSCTVLNKPKPLATVKKVTLVKLTDQQQSDNIVRNWAFQDTLRKFMSEVRDLDPSSFQVKNGKITFADSSAFKTISFYKAYGLDSTKRILPDTTIIIIPLTP